ncbi:TetR/AcrR family transcriptional regulator [Cellulomonas sp. WB94]|uniref:TetR/AcrR family transcriptional regulator n=1 Tax=Cellulomonas sp. WB94 TaxID=2173174 RepID=UPI0013048091|nr:TetR/AcrR family transcriptional regulator [Cellulomonas sp. WB94]
MTGDLNEPSTTRESKSPDERREEIVVAARALFSERGIGKTSISDVATRVGVTRGLIYHYFGDKDALVDVVLERYIDEFVTSIRMWDAAREVGNIELALTDCIGLFRHHLQDDDPLRGDLHRIENAALYYRFVDRAVTAVVDCIRATTVKAYALRHQMEIENVYETFYVLVYGLVGLTRSRPEIEDRVLVGIVRQTLHLDGRPATNPRPDGGPAKVQGD